MVFFSGVARELAPGEVVWLELNFESAAEFDDAMLPLVDAVEAESGHDSIVALEQLKQQFLEPTVKGANLSVSVVSYNAIRLLDWR